MKKIKYTFIGVLLAFMFSCSTDQENVFDKSPSERKELSLKEYQKLLKSAEYGWAAELYFGGKETVYGGKMHTMQFVHNDEKKIDEVKVMAADAGSSVVGSSEYAVIFNGGPSLAFSTYNNVFHGFTAPKVFDFWGTQFVWEGYKGDDEFILLSHTDDEIVIKGKRFGKVTKMTKLKEPASDYIVKVNKIFSTLVAFGSFKGTAISVNKQMMDLVSMESGDGYFTYKFLEDGKLVKKTQLFIITDKGMKFTKPLTIDGVTVDFLKYIEGENCFKSEDGKVVFYLGKKFPFDVQNTVWGIYSDNLAIVSNEFKKKFDEVSAKNSQIYPNESLSANIRIGKTQDGVSGITFASKYIDNPKKGHRVVFYFGYKNVSDTEIGFDFRGEGSKSVDYQHLKPMQQFIIDNSPYTYKFMKGGKELKSSSGARVVELKSTKDPNISFSLYKLRNNGTPWEALP